MKTKMEIYKLLIEDATHLGGPMGTEYTTPILRKSFIKQEKAIDFANKWMRKETKDKDYKIDFKRDRNRIYSDERFVIVTIEKEKVE